MMLVRDVTQQLSAPFADSPVLGWSVPARASALRRMLDALTTEDARTAGKVDLLYQNQFVETTALAAGDVTRAIKYFEDSANLAKIGIDIDRVFPWVRDTDQSLYLDYLRAVS